MGAGVLDPFGNDEDRLWTSIDTTLVKGVVIPAMVVEEPVLDPFPENILMLQIKVKLHGASTRNSRGRG